jgi:hypothetical protein
MKIKRILIITYGFYPVQSPRSYRATELAKEFSRQGHNVTVMTPYREGIEDLIKEYPILIKSLGVLKWKIFNFKGFGLLGRLYNKAVNRLLPLLFEYPMIELYFKIRNALKIEKDEYDLLISIAVPYPVHWGVASVWNRKGNNISKTWVADCGDPYCLQENDTIRPPFYFSCIEKWFMQKTNYITVPTSTSYFGYFSMFHAKIKVIPQGFKFEDVKLKNRIEDGVIRFAYAGGFAVGRRDPTEILNFLTNLNQTFKFEFHIYTRHIKFVEEYVKIDNRIKLHGFKPRLELLSELSQFDFMINLENFGEAQSPSKLIDYGIIKKPILSLKSFDLNYNLLNEFLKRDFSNSYSIEYLEGYRIENVVQQFLNLNENIFLNTDHINETQI